MVFVRNRLRPCFDLFLCRQVMPSVTALFVKKPPSRVVCFLVQKLDVIIRLSISGNGRASRCSIDRILSRFPSLYHVGHEQYLPCMREKGNLRTPQVGALVRLRRHLRKDQVTRRILLFAHGPRGKWRSLPCNKVMALVGANAYSRQCPF